MICKRSKRQHNNQTSSRSDWVMQLFKKIRMQDWQLVIHDMILSDRPNKEGTWYRFLSYPQSKRSDVREVQSSKVWWQEDFRGSSWMTIKHIGTVPSSSTLGFFTNRKNQYHISKDGSEDLTAKKFTVNKIWQIIWILTYNLTRKFDQSLVQ